jgi:hypothetical protein
MYVVWLAALLLGSGFAIVGGQGARWKLLNFGIIAGSMAAGFGIGYAAGLGSVNFGRVPHAALPISLMFGIVAALACIQLNSWREK